MPPVFLTAPNITTPHGFFARQGGVSTAPYDSLNVGYASHDLSAHVTENRNRCVAALDAAGLPLLTPKQTHSALCLVVPPLFSADSPPEADALITMRDDVVLGVQTADCVPLLVYEENAGIIAAIHAGWKGAFAGVVQATFKQLKALGGFPEHCQVALGPSIQQVSYQVDEAFRQQWITRHRLSAACFTPDAAGFFRFDLPKFIIGLLLALGVRDIEAMPYDTYTDARFFSFRRATHNGEADYGRQLSAITLAGS